LDLETLRRDLEEMGTEAATISVIESYLVGKKVKLTVEKSTSWCKLTKRCPQGSQLGRTFWKVAMSKILMGGKENWVKLVAYADNLVMLIAEAKVEAIRKRLCMQMNELMSWTKEIRFSFSMAKTKAMSIKGGLKPWFEVRLGNERIVSSSPVKYLVVLVDYKRNYWE